VKTNILGTENVLEVAISCGVKRVICLSTDKAVYPINAMGISKAMMEKVIVAKARITNTDKIQQMIARIGYDTEKNKATDEAYNNLHHCCQYEREQ
jgi:UDP-glucose 4-epimerase